MLLFVATTLPTCDICDRRTWLSHTHLEALLKALQLGIATAPILRLLIGTNGCSQEMKQWLQQKIDQTVQTFQTLSTFQSELAHQYHTRNVGVEINYIIADPGQARAIAVQLTNTLLNQASPEERAKVAKDVARHAKAHFMLNHPQDTVSVSFVEFKHFAIVQYTQTLDAYTLNAAELESPTPVSVAPSSSEP